MWRKWVQRDATNGQVAAGLKNIEDIYGYGEALEEKKTKHIYYITIKK